MAPAPILMSNVTSDLSPWQDPGGDRAVPSISRRIDMVLSKRLQQSSGSSCCIDQSPHHQPGESAGVAATWAERIGRLVRTQVPFVLPTRCLVGDLSPPDRGDQQNCYTHGTEECPCCEPIRKTSCELAYGVVIGL